jgi:uncharacterized damage-inducible protein DinB
MDIHHDGSESMQMKDFLLAELEREVARSRRALEEVPSGKYDWKPHDKSMSLGHLADMVATIPNWVAAIVTQDSLDVAPAAGPGMKPTPKTTAAELVRALDEAAAAGRKALASTTDDHLKTAWQLKARGNVVQEAPRHEFIADTLNHWAHHRGQMTVYLRLLGAKVPSIYGPSADDQTFK